MHVRIHEDVLEDDRGNEQCLAARAEEERNEEGLHRMLGKRDRDMLKVVPRSR